MTDSPDKDERRTVQDESTGDTLRSPESDLDENPGTERIPDDSGTVDAAELSAADGLVPKSQSDPDSVEQATQRESGRTMAAADAAGTNESGEWLEIPNPHTQRESADRATDQSFELSGAGRQGETGHAPPADTSPGQRRRADHTQMPEHIAGYETISRLGEGSFGIVLKCRDIKLDRLVAIKLQKVNPLNSKSRVDRFLGEARAAGQLRHPHIVPVYEFGEFAGNQFIVYEFVDGMTLDEWFDHHVDDEPRVQMMAKIADALEYAHSLGIVHRDIKPANILIDHQHQQPHIADFGCAKHENPDGLQTVDGSVMGTPAYMSPEVCEGFANQADGRADQWAVGVMLYEMLTGKRPFKGKYASLFQQIRSAEPRRPRQINPSAPAELETITLKCLEKDKQRRYESCAHLASDLRNWLEGRPITARKVSLLERTWLWSKRNPTVATLAGIVSACLILIAIGSVLFSIHAANQRAEILARQNEIIDNRIAQLGSAPATALPAIIEDLVELDPESIEQVRLRLAQENRGPRDSFPFNLALYRLARASNSPADAAWQGLLQYVPVGTAEMHGALLELAGTDLKSEAEYFHLMASDTARPPSERMLAISILANTDPNHADWSQWIDPALEYLLVEPTTEIAKWTRLLKPVAGHFQAGVRSRFYSEDDSVGLQTAVIAANLFEDQIDFLVEVGLKARPEQLRPFRTALKRFGPDRVATAGPPVASISPRQRTNLYLMQALAWTPSSDNLAITALDVDLPTEVRHRLIHDCGLANVPVESLIDRLVQATGDDLVKRRAPDLVAVILALGNYNRQQLSQSRREILKAPLLTLFREHRDAAVHSSSRWLLEQWGFAEDLKGLLSDIQTPQPREGYGWHEDPLTGCFVVFDFIGDEATYQFGVATHEFSIDQFRKIESQVIQKLESGIHDSDEAGDLAKTVARLKQFRDNRDEEQRYDPAESRAPVAYVTWSYIAWQCNQMNRMAGLATDQDVYRDVGSWDVTPASSPFTELAGYRLPTSAEWEMACGGAGNTPYFYGAPADLFEGYGWSVRNSRNVRQPIGKLKPNDQGMFDIQGNVAEYCHDLRDPTGSNRGRRIVRGQSCAEATLDIDRNLITDALPRQRHPRRGFRLARTYPTAEQDQAVKKKQP